MGSVGGEVGSGPGTGPGGEDPGTPGSPSDPADPTTPDDPIRVPGFVCDDAAKAGASLSRAQTQFTSRVYPLLTRAQGGCMGCHAQGSNRPFLVLDGADDTFRRAQAAGLLGSGAGGLLARVTQTEAALRMPLGQAAWSPEEVVELAKVACDVAALEQVVCTPGQVHAGQTPMRRLTHREYDNTVRDLLGISTRPAQTGFSPELIAEGWFNNEAALLVVDEGLARDYRGAAEALALTATNNLPGLTGCAAPVTDTCAKTFLRTQLAPRAYRRPLTTDESTRLMALYDWGKAELGTTRDAVQVVLESVLQSPAFLYRYEKAPASPTAKPSSHEMASRLSYFFWQTMPDTTLRQLADEDKLQDATTVRAQAERLAAAPQARATVADFHRQWLSLDEVMEISKDATVFTGWTDALRGHMRRESELFVEHVFWETPSADASELLTANYSFMNKPLADFFGVPGPTGTTFERVMLPANRVGLLGKGAFLATQALADQTHPIYRGKYVLTRLLGKELGAPPTTDSQGNPIDLPPVDPSKTTRERFEQHSSDALCVGCHRALDPLGFALESYDGAGRWRSTEAAGPVDTQVTLVSPESVKGPVAGPVALAQTLSQSPDFHRALVERWFAFAFGRHPLAQDACTLQALEQAFVSSGHNMRQLFTTLPQSDAFLYRGAVPGVTP